MNTTLFRNSRPGSIVLFAGQQQSRILPDGMRMDLARTRLEQLRARFRYIIGYFIGRGCDTFVTGLASDFERMGAEEVLAARSQNPSVRLFIVDQPQQGPDEFGLRCLREQADGHIAGLGDELPPEIRAAVIYYDGEKRDPFRRKAEWMSEQDFAVVDIAPTAAARPYDRNIPQPVIDEMILQGSRLTGPLLGKWMLTAHQEEYDGNGLWSAPHYQPEGECTSVRDYRNDRRVVYQEVVVGAEHIPDLPDIGEPGFSDRLFEPHARSDDAPTLRTGERAAYMDYEFDRESGYLNDPYNRACRAILLNDDELVTLSFDTQDRGIVSRYIHKRVKNC